jgi:hypothetical protein
LKSLFGEVPLGTRNVISKALQAEAFGADKPAGKAVGVPGGQGVLIKNEGKREE